MFLPPEWTGAGNTQVRELDETAGAGGNLSSASLETPRGTFSTGGDTWRRPRPCPDFSPEDLQAEEQTNLTAAPRKTWIRLDVAYAAGQRGKTAIPLCEVEPTRLNQPPMNSRVG